MNKRVLFLLVAVAAGLSCSAAFGQVAWTYSYATPVTTYYSYSPYTTHSPVVTNWSYPTSSVVYSSSYTAPVVASAVPRTTYYSAYQPVVPAYTAYSPSATYYTYSVPYSAYSVPYTTYYSVPMTTTYYGTPAVVRYSPYVPGQPIRNALRSLY